MPRHHVPRSGTPLLILILLGGLLGCGDAARSQALDPELARTSLQKAMQAWVDGKSPKDLQPEIIMGDTGWEQGRKLVAFELLTGDETSDGSNLHIHVKRKFDDDGTAAESTVKYIIGTSPVITIFPQ